MLDVTTTDIVKAEVKNTILLTVLRDPFDYTKREVKSISWTGDNVQHYVEEFFGEPFPDYDVIASVNGSLIDPAITFPNPGSNIVFSLTPSNTTDVGRTLLMIGVISLSFWLPGALPAVFTTNAFLQGLTIAVTGVVGSLLINAILPPVTGDDIGTGASSTYSWSGVNQINEGFAAPVIYGTTKIIPYLIGKYISNEWVGGWGTPDKQRLGLLYFLCDHALDKIENDQINGSPATGYTDVQLHKRYGDYTQQVIPNFQDTRTQQSIGAKFTTSYNTVDVPGTDITGVGFGLSFPNGMGYYNDDGSWESLSTEVYIDIRKKGASTWRALLGDLTGETSVSAYVGNYCDSQVIISYNGTTKIGQPFYGDGNKLKQANFRIKKIAGSGTINATLHKVTAGYNAEYGYVDDTISSTVLATSTNTRNISALQTNFYSYTFLFDETFITGKGVRYCLVLNFTPAAGSSAAVQYASSISSESLAVADVANSTGLIRNRWTYDDDWAKSNTTVFAHYIITARLSTFSAGENTPIRYSKSKKGLSQGTYELRYKCSAVTDAGGRNMRDLYLDYVEGIVEDDFMYPGASLVGVDALATDQLSGGLPAYSCVATRYYVSIWNGSAWVNKNANNPAWATWDMIVNPVYGGGEDETKMIYSDFSTWADFCTANGYFCNICFDTTDSFQTAKAKLEILGRARVVQKGTKWGVIIDKTASPVQLFAVGNIIENTFKSTYTSVSERANVIECTYFDETRDYERMSFDLRTSTFDQGGIDPNKISMVLQGATKREVAVRLAKFMLNCNQYLIRSVEFEVWLKALGSNVGDVIYVSHDIPQWGYSGKVVSATANTVTLDREVTLSPGTTYYVMVSHYDDDDLEEVEIQSVAIETTTDELTLTGVWGQIPAEHDDYFFGHTSGTAKKFRIYNITRTQRQRRRIQALEYIDEVYDDNATVPDYEDLSDLEPYVEGVTATEIWRKEGGVMISVVRVTWRGFGIHYLFMKEDVEDVWRLIHTSTGELFYDVKNLEPGKTYYFAVSCTNNPTEGSIDATTTTDTSDGIDFVGYTAPRIIWPVTGLQVEGMGNSGIFQNRDLKLVWNLSTTYFPSGTSDNSLGAGTYPPMSDFGGYLIKIYDNNGNLRREFEQFENKYNYSYEKNSEDGCLGSLSFKDAKGTFTAGEWIYGGTSNAYAKISSVGGNRVWISNVVGTFVDGEVIYQADYGSELITDGDCSSDSFSKSSGWTHNAGTEEYDCDGTLGANLYQNVLTVGNFYKVVFKVQNYSSGSVRPSAGDSGQGTLRSADNTYTEHLQCKSTTYAYLQSVNFVGSVDDISWKQIINAALAVGTVSFQSAGSTSDAEPNLIIKIWAKDKYGKTSEYPAVLSVTNPAPSAPSGLTVTSFLKGVKATWIKNTEIDIDYYLYRTKVESDSWSSWEKITNLEVIRALSQSEQDDWTSMATIYFEVKAVDTFGNYSSASSGSASAEGLFISPEDIPEELYLSLTISDSDSNSTSTLAALYDRNKTTGGVAYSVTAGTDKWIEFSYPLSYLIDRVCVWANTSTLRAYIAYTEDGSTWNYLSGEADNTLDANGELVEAADQSTAQTNYWLLDATANSINMAIFPAQIVVKAVRLYLTGTISGTIRELVFVRQVIAEQIIADQLSAISAELGSVTVTSGEGIVVESGGDIVLEGGTEGNPSLLRFINSNVPAEIRFEGTEVTDKYHSLRNYPNVTEEGQQNYTDSLILEPFGMEYDTGDRVEAWFAIGTYDYPYYIVDIHSRQIRFYTPIVDFYADYIEFGGIVKFNTLFYFTEGNNAPGSPLGGRHYVWAESDNSLHYIDGNGTEYTLDKTAV